MPTHIPITDFDHGIRCQTFVETKASTCGEQATFYTKGTQGNLWSGWHCDPHTLDVLRSMGHQGGTIAVPIVSELPCGPTGDDMFCACGCGGDDTRCPRYLWYYHTNRQVPADHVCCEVPGR